MNTIDYSGLRSALNTFTKNQTLSKLTNQFVATQKALITSALLPKVKFCPAIKQFVVCNLVNSAEVFYFNFSFLLLNLSCFGHLFVFNLYIHGELVYLSNWSQPLQKISSRLSFLKKLIMFIISFL